MELRDKLLVICSGNPKILRRYMAGTTDLTDAHEAAVTAGGENPALNKLRRFRRWLAETTTEDDLVEPSKAIRDAILYELKEIERKARNLEVAVEAARIEN